jgi:glycosyltransferase involved in cell wall biosynthesis
MRIGVDARDLAGHSTGVGRYLGGLLREWCGGERASPHDFVLYSHAPVSVPFDQTRVRLRTVPGTGGTWWQQVQLRTEATRDRLDLFFAPGYAAPLRLPIPVVVAVHDVSFAAHPEWFAAREGLRLRWLARRTAQAAKAVITISEFSRCEIIEHLGVNDTRIRVIPPGISPPPRSQALDAKGPSVLFVGSIFNRRHVPDLIRAFTPIARRHPSISLDIVGDNRSFPHEDLSGIVAAEQLEGRVRLRSYVDDRELGALYASARAFAFLSEYEGLGLTPLEALATGVPPVLLDTPVAHESCGAAALYVKPGDVAATTQALELLLFDEATRARLVQAAPRVLERYNWPRAAAQTLSVLEEAG